MPKGKEISWIDKLLVDEKTKLANTVMGKVVHEVLNAIAFREIYRHANENDDLFASFDKTREARVFNFIRDALYSSLILSLMKIYDQPRKNTASLQTLAHILSDDSVAKKLYQEIVIEYVERPLNVSHGPNLSAEEVKELVARERRLDAPEHASDRVDQFKEAVTEVLKMKGDHQLDALRRYRNEHLGHLAVNADGAKKAKYGYAEDVLDNTVLIVQNLSLGLHSADQNFEAFIQDWQELSEVFWKRSLNMK